MKKLTFVAIALFAVACTKKGDKTEKQPDGTKVVAKDPKVTEPPAAPKMITVTTKSPEAKAAFDKGADLMINARGPEAAPDFKKAIELDADFAQAHAYLGVVTPGAEGMAELEKAASLAAKLPDAERAWIDGFRLMRTGDDKATSAAFTKVTELAPDDYRGFLQLANIANQNADHASALKMFEKVGQMRPDLAIVQNGLAYTNAGLKQWDAAIAAAKKQTELLPKEPNPQDTLGEIQLMSGKFEDSEKSFQQALTLEPKFTLAWQGVALARAYRGDWKGAAEANDKRLATSTERDEKIGARLDMAWLAAAAGKPADAYSLLDGIDKDAANATAPSYGGAATDRGMLLQLQGKYPESAKALAEGVKRTEQLPGVAKRNAERSYAIGTLRIAALTSKAAPDADKLVATTEDGANSPLGKSVNAWARGLAAWAKTGPKDAVGELSRCEPTFAMCRFDLAAAQRKAGEAAGADATEKQIAETFLRDPGNVYIQSLLKKTK